ncbi:hypothetical protein BJF96_g7178 [Verticillium dahliae]|uniref:Uncharacterized protein n=1 Tax=Verticillium dahliae TaxID=27337 RepID=A0AA44WHV8_VERDA|nr:hypothetical protein BJF96_g7178 [Verticillium dahliae]
MNPRWLDNNKKKFYSISRFKLGQFSHSTHQSRMKFTTVLVGLVAFFSTAAMALPSPVGAETVDKDLEKRQMCSPCYRGFRSCCSTGGNCYTAKC